jgi:hypothetical protein
LNTITHHRRRYHVTYNDHSWTFGTDLVGLHRIRGLLGAARANRLPIAVTTTIDTAQVRLCSWCRARPRAWEWDCDGAYQLALCDDPQCCHARRAAWEGVIAPPAHIAARSRRLALPAGTASRRAD